jgi:hypothetical protein
MFVADLPFLATVTLAVFLPLKFALHLLFAALEISTAGLLSYALDGAGSFVLAALVAPAVTYGLTARLADQKTPPLAECLRWGRLQWARTLWNNLKVSVTVALWGALLVVPGLVKLTRLIFAEPVVAIEGNAAGDVLGRSGEIAAGHRWRIFAVLFPLGILDMVASFLVLQTFRGERFTWTTVAAVDCVLAVCEQLGTVAILLMYLGLTRQAPHRS